MEQLWDLGRLATRGILPDLTLVLDLPLEAARRRKQAGAARVDVILQGRQPIVLTATRLTELDLPLDWAEQHRLLVKLSEPQI